MHASAVTHGPCGEGQLTSYSHPSPCEFTLHGMFSSTSVFGLSEGPGHVTCCVAQPSEPSLALDRFIKLLRVGDYDEATAKSEAAQQ